MAINRDSARSRAKDYTKSKKKGSMKGMTVKGGHKLPTSRGAGLTAKGRASINRRTGSNLKAPAPNPKTKKDAARRKSFCARSKGWTGKEVRQQDADGIANSCLFYLLDFLWGSPTAIIW